MGGSTSKEAPVSAQDLSATEKTSPQQKNLSTPLAREKLPPALQKIVNDDDTLFEQIYDGTAGDTTDSSIRYAAYANRIRTIMTSAHRYVAYTSDIGESFRPIAHPWLIRGAYGVSWAYLIGDVSFEARKAYMRQQSFLHPTPPGLIAKKATDASESASTTSNGTQVEIVPLQHLKEPRLVPALEDWRTVAVQRALFQSIASMGLPAFTIHSIVRYSGRTLKDVKNPRIRTWGPVALGLAAVPALPFLFDQPVETAIEWAFHRVFEAVGGPEAVGHSAPTGREKEMTQDRRNAGKVKEKEL